MPSKRLDLSAPDLDRLGQEAVFAAKSANHGLYRDTGVLGDTVEGDLVERFCGKVTLGDSEADANSLECLP